MTQYCPDCGGILERSGICGNCDEELHIMTHQVEYVEEPLSQEFIQQAMKSSSKIAQRGNRDNQN